MEIFIKLAIIVVCIIIYFVSGKLDNIFSKRVFKAICFISVIVAIIALISLIPGDGSKMNYCFYYLPIGNA